MNKKIEQLEQLFQPVLATLSLDLWGVVLVSESGRNVLRVYLNKADGVSADDCSQASRQLGALLDVENIMPTKYTLEVSSPGLNRPLLKLAHYQQAINQRANIHFRVRQADRRRIEAVITAVDNDLIHVDFEGSALSFPVSAVEKACIIPNFEELL